MEIFLGFYWVICGLVATVVILDNGPGDVPKAIMFPIAFMIGMLIGGFVVPARMLYKAAH